MSIGTSLPRLEDKRLLRGAARFIDDVRPEGCLHVAFLRSPHAHARVRGVDISAALLAPGVEAVVAASDLRDSCAPMRVHLTTPGVAGAGWRPPVHAKTRFPRDPRPGV